MTDQPSQTPDAQPSAEPTADYAYQPATVPPDATPVLEDAPHASTSRRTWWIVGGVAAGLALWVFGMFAGVAASEIFHGGHDFDGPGGNLAVPGGQPVPGTQVPGGQPGAPIPDFDGDDDSGGIPDFDDDSGSESDD